MEIWKDVDGYNGKYAISNKGRLRMQDGRISTGWIQNKYGYRKCRLYTETSSSDFYVHQLVAKAFIDNPFGYGAVNHIDHNPSNNDSNNLEWTTQKLNMQHAARHGRMSNGNTVYNVITKKIFASVKSAANSIGMNPNTLTCKLLGKTKNDTPFITLKHKKSLTTI